LPLQQDVLLAWSNNREKGLFMPKVLLVDDDPYLRDLVTRILSKSNFDVATANDGPSGLKQARALRPDLIILDVIMPGMDGFEVVRQLHDDPDCGQIPIMILTAYATPYGRKTSIEVGVDAFVTKPFDARELAAKANAMITAPDRSVNRQTAPLEKSRLARRISIHSLRGGLGSTALATNLAFALQNLWHKPTLLVDADFSMGQINMNLDWSGGLSWSDLLRASGTNSLAQALVDASMKYNADLHILTAPRNPVESDLFGPRLVRQCLDLLQKQYEYIIADLSHDFRKNTCELLRDSDIIVHLLSPEVVSLESAKKALELYVSSGIEDGKVKLILVDVRPERPQPIAKIEEFLGQSLFAHIPYASEMTRAIDRGEPFINAYPRHAISGLFGDLAFLLSKPEHKEESKAKTSAAKELARPEDIPVRQNGASHDTPRSLLKRFGLNP
jgi:pilus assembly protein CpaE